MSKIKKVKVRGVRCKKDNVTFIAIEGNNVIKRTVNKRVFDDWEAFSKWYLSQEEADFILDSSKEKDLDISFHERDVEEGGVSRVIKEKVFDGVEVKDARD